MTRRQLIEKVRKSVWSLHCTVTDPQMVRKLPTTELEEILQELILVELEIEQSL